MFKPIKLSAGWPLRGATTIDQLNAILTDLHCHHPFDGIDGTTARLNIDRKIVENVAAHYQSLWMHA